MGHLPVGFGDLRRRELIRCGLVLVTLSELRGNPGLLQQPTEEGDVDLDAADAKPTSGLKPDGAACCGELVGGQGVAEFPERLGPRHGRSSRPEGLDQLGDLVHHRHRLAAVHGVNDQPGDTLIFTRSLEVFAKVADRSRPHHLKHLQGVPRKGLQHSPGKVKFEHNAPGGAWQLVEEGLEHHVVSLPTATNTPPGKQFRDRALRAPNGPS